MIKFHQLVEGGFAPRRASKSANGTLPTDAYRYCEPVRTASAFGWYVYLPMDFQLYWDGAEIHWSIDGGDHWHPLIDAIQYPGFAARFDAAAPDGCKGFAPPFMTRTTEHDSVQIWTGALISTPPDIAALVRPPVNANWRNDYTAWEGVIETDRWFGPLIVNLRLRRPDTPIVFRRTTPIAQVQPIPRAMLRACEQEPIDVSEGVDTMSEADWTDFESTVVRRMTTRKRLGEYAAETRKRAKAPAE